MVVQKSDIALKGPHIYECWLQQKGQGMQILNQEVKGKQQEQKVKDSMHIYCTQEKRIGGTMFIFLVGIEH